MAPGRRHEAEKEAAVAKAKADAPEQAAPVTAAVVDRTPAEGGKRARKVPVEAEAAVVDTPVEASAEEKTEE